MRRREFVSGTVAAAVAGLAGCLGGENAPQTDDDHLDALRTELDERGVILESIELEDGVVEVEHGYDDDPNDAVANVAMAFVERIADDWNVERLDGYLRDDGNDWTWYAESEWAAAYANGEIEPDEYGERLSETMSMVLESEDE